MLVPFPVDMALSTLRASLPAGAQSLSRSRCSRRCAVQIRASATTVDDETGIKLARKGIKEAADENVLTPRFYTTDFEEMARL